MAGAASREPSRGFAQSIYRAVADGTSALIAATPPLEPLYLRASRRWWSTPAIGRFAQSVGYRLVDRLAASGNQIRTVTIAGVPFTVDVSGWLFSGPYLTGRMYEPATVRWMLERLKPGGVFVDIGANSGYFSLLGAATVGPAGRVLAIEPNPAVRRQLDAHIRLNDFQQRIESFQVALADTTGSLELFVGGHDGFSTVDPSASPNPAYLENATRVMVPASTFDAWIDAVGVTHVDIVKMDVEGVEERVVAGMARSLASGTIDRVICEMEADSRLFSVFSSYGYSAERIEAVGPVHNIGFSRARA